MCSNYFDDYAQLEAGELATSAETCMKDLFKLLGFRLAETESKDKPFSEVFDPLGVRVDLSESQRGVVKVAPKPSRVESVLAEVMGP